MKSHQIIILRSSQVIQISLFLGIIALIALQITLLIACVFNIDTGIPRTELSFGIYG